MQKNVKNGLIIRNIKEGNFLTITKNVLMDKNLTDSGVRLLMLLIDTPPSTKISLSWTKITLKWSNDKLSAASKNLVENGYLRITKHPKGVDNGFVYTYVVSEFGNLKTTTDENGEVIKMNTPTPKKKKPVVNEEPIQEAVVNEEPIKEPVMIGKNEADKKILFIKIYDILSIALPADHNEEHTNKIIQHYENKVNDGSITLANLDEQSIKIKISNSISKFNAELSSSYKTNLELLFISEIDAGKKDQKESIKAKMWDWCVTNNYPTDQKELKDKLLKIKNSVLTKNRDQNQYYQN